MPTAVDQTRTVTTRRILQIMPAPPDLQVKFKTPPSPLTTWRKVLALALTRVRMSYIQDGSLAQSYTAVVPVVAGDVAKGEASMVLADEVPGYQGL